jgi:NAD(P)-dependent dehydrogenase (short-subunit alcohol dehydrogenase family)
MRPRPRLTCSGSAYLPTLKEPPPDGARQTRKGAAAPERDIFSPLRQYERSWKIIIIRATYRLRGKGHFMIALEGENMVVIGGSRGVGRRIFEAAIRNWAQVLAVARQETPLQQLAHEVPGVETLALDATDEISPSKVFDGLMPDILILGGTFPPAASIHEQSWQQFSANWENDVRIAFNFCKAAITRPLPVGTLVVIVSSGATLAGSPLSGEYAGAKRTQIFIANNSQKESDRLGLGLRFMTTMPRIVPDTDLGKHAITGYSRCLGISADDFVRGMAAPPTSHIVATAVIELVA